MLAPTAMNLQKFRLVLTDPHSVRAEATGGPYAEVGLGIVRYHFEIGAGTENFEWDPVPEKSGSKRRSSGHSGAESGAVPGDISAAAFAASEK